MPRSRSRSLLSMRPLGHLLVGAERAGLLQQPVDQGRLAVVDVGDDRDVAEIHRRAPKKKRPDRPGRAALDIGACATGTSRATHKATCAWRRRDARSNGESWQQCAAKWSPSAPSCCLARSSTATRPGSASSWRWPASTRTSRPRSATISTRIVACIRLALGRSDAVIMCGGLGPTQDDITREAIAEVMGVPLVRSDELVQKITALFAARGRAMAANNLRQADVPVGADADPEMPGTAPGLICPLGEPGDLRRAGRAARDADHARGRGAARSAAARGPARR